MIGVVGAPLYGANDLYWDTNGTADGSGAAAGTWGVGNFWNSDPAGIANTFQVTTGSTNDLHFSAGTNGGTGTINVSGTQFANGLYFEESALFLGGAGAISLTDGAIINNSTGTLIPTISANLTTTGSVTLTGTRIWLDNSSFAGGGTLNVNTSNATLLENGGALNGLSVININSGGLDIRQSRNGYDYAAGTTLNFVNSSGLNTNLAAIPVNWLGNIVIASTKTATLSAFSAGSSFTIAGNISGAGAVTIGGSGVMIFSGANTYAGTTNVSGATLRVTGGNAIANTGLVAMGTSATPNTFEVQTSETIGALSGGTLANSIVNIAAGQVLTLSSGTQTYSGAFSGSGALAVAGAVETIANSVTLGEARVSSGTLVLSSANTITSGLSISGGIVQLRNETAAGASVILATGGTIQAAVARGSSLTIANGITVSAGSRVTLSPQINGGSAGTATINFGGILTINAGGFLQLGAPATNAAYGTANGAVAFGAGATSGTKFQLNGNNFTVAGLSTDAGSPGSPAVENGSAANVTLTVALPASGASTYAGTYAGTLRNGGVGTLALTVSGGAGSTLKLAGANTFTGATSVSGGSLIVAHERALQNSTVTSGGTGLAFDASVASHAFTFGGLSGSTNLVLEDNATVPNAVTLSIGNNGTAQTYTGVLSGSGGLTKVGAGIQTMAGANTYTGATTVNGGELREDFSIAGAPLTNIFSSSSTLVLGGGMFSQRQLTNVNANGQTFNGLSVRAGSSVVNQVRAGSGVLSLTLGAVSRDVGGTVVFSANGGGASGISATGTNTASGIIGGYATYLTTNGGATNTNGVDWATFSGGKIIGLLAGSYAHTAATTTATNLDMTSSLTLNPNVTVGSIRFNNAIATPTLTLNGAHIVGSGGILITGNVGANATNITGGSITSGNGLDLIVIQNNTNAAGALTINAVITGAISLTKSGGGQMILVAANEYTGQTYLNGGVTSISSNANLGAAATGAAVNFNGGTLSVTSTIALDNGGNNSRNLVMGNNGGTVDVAANQVLTVSGVISGEGSFNKTGSGSLVLTGTNTLIGNTTVTAGNLQVGINGFGQTGPGLVNLNGAGAVISGSGTLQGLTTVTLGALKPGDSGGASVGTLNTGDLTFAPTSTTTVAELQITGSSGTSTLAADKLMITGALTLNGNSNITVNGDSYIPSLGDTFVLLDWTTVLDTGATSIFNTGTNYRTGANIGNEGNLDLPDISSYTFTWDIRDFAGNGSLTLVVIPEPARALLALIGLMALGLRRRRA